MGAQIKLNCSELYQQKNIIPGKYCITELLPSNESMTRKQSHPDEYSQAIIDSLSESDISILPAIPVVFGRLEQVSVS